MKGDKMLLVASTYIKEKTEDINVSTSEAKGAIFYFTIIFNFLDEKFWKRSDFISLMKVLEIFGNVVAVFIIEIFSQEKEIFSLITMILLVIILKLFLYHEDFLILLLDPETIT